MQISLFKNTAELWKFRALISALVIRHLNARYRGSVLGFFWSFLTPLCLIAVYSLVFKYYIRFNQVENYTLFMFTGLLPWIWFSSGLLEATGSISGGGHLITKAMFPAHVLPFVFVTTNLINFLLSLPLLLGFMLFAGLTPSLTVLWLPLIVIIEMLFLFGMALTLAAINVRFRDVQHILANLLTLWFFLCPIIYPVESIPPQFKFTLLLNPVAQFTVMYHDVLIAGVCPSFKILSYTFLFSTLALVIGNYVFEHFREEFAELV